MAKLIKDMNPANHCHDCGVSIGELHVPGCDNEACTKCGLQRISCGCTSNKRERWTGIAREKMLRVCEEHGWYTKWENGKGWVPAKLEDENSMHDLNKAAVFLTQNK